MAHGRNKYQSRDSRDRVRHLFWHEWDPIGISGHNESSDEYDRYADAAYVMLMDHNARAAEIADYLFDAATDYMGLTGNSALRKKCDDVAERLVSFRPDFLTH